MIIYQITCNITGQRYFGSTTKTLKKRIKSHRDCYVGYKNGKTTNCKAYDIFDRGDYEFEIVEDLTEYGCDKDDLLQIEGWYIQNFECINKQIAGRSKAQYMEDNKEYFNERRNKRWHQTKDEVNAKRRERVNCPHCNLELARSSLLKHNRIYHYHYHL